MFIFIMFLLVVFLFPLALSCPSRNYLIYILSFNYHMISQGDKNSIIFKRQLVPLLLLLGHAIGHPTWTGASRLLYTCVYANGAHYLLLIYFWSFVHLIHSLSSIIGQVNELQCMVSLVRFIPWSTKEFRFLIYRKWIENN